MNALQLRSNNANKDEGRKPLWGSEVKYSDQIANGDADDDKEVQDEDDHSDIIADDNGFVKQYLG